MLNFLALWKGDTPKDVKDAHWNFIPPTPKKDTLWWIRYGSPRYQDNLSSKPRKTAHKNVFEKFISLVCTFWMSSLSNVSHMCSQLHALEKHQEDG